MTLQEILLIKYGPVIFTKDVVEFTRLTENTVLALIKDGELRSAFRKLGRQWVASVPDFVAAFEALPQAEKHMAPDIVKLVRGAQV